MRHACALAVGIVVSFVASSPVVVGQTLLGRVLDDVDDRPVATALVRLVDADGQERAISIADSIGAFRIEAPGPGTYRLVAERLGFEPFESPLLEAARPEASYTVDLLLRRLPVEIPGLSVEAQRVPAERVERQLRLMLGASLGSLRNRPIGPDEIQDHAERGRGLEDALRWSAIPGLIVRTTPDGPCFSLRGYGCLPVYLNGLQLSRDFAQDVPLDMIHTIVIVVPRTDPVISYPSGAVLLYTAAWLR